jgi:hypothetical protein
VVADTVGGGDIPEPSGLWRMLSIPSDKEKLNGGAGTQKPHPLDQFIKSFHCIEPTDEKQKGQPRVETYFTAGVGFGLRFEERQVHPAGNDADA